MESDIQSAYQEELLRLEEAGRIINRQLEELNAMPRYSGNDFTEQVLEGLREETRRKLATALPEPYFGRLDFQEAGHSGPTPLYIGKAGVEDRIGGNPLVIDWRAPAASLFYSFTGGDGPAEYDSPDGLVEGLVYLKRNLVIRKQILQRVTDSYMRGSGQGAVTDEFLLYRLGENKDNKLRDIVSTIQAEQDKIIRAAKNKALIIQGVAGSGKTTVALHRLAFLLYQYRDQVKAERMIIFAPNRMFLDYISGVLPELGVGDIAQTTFADWALERLDDNLKLGGEAQDLEKRFAVAAGPENAGKPDAQEPVPSGRWKGSAELADYLNRELDVYEKEYCLTQDFIPWEGTRQLPGKTIRHWFDVEIAHEPIGKRRQRVEARIRRWLEMELEATRDPKIRKDRKKLAGTRLKAYLKKWSPPSALEFYRRLFEPETRPAWVPEQLAEETRKRLAKREVLQEDLAALLHIHNRFYGIHGNDRFDHIVIDEAQDFSPLQVLVLKAHSKNHSFTILGDLAQGIHDYKGVRSWEEFAGLFGPEETETFQLNRSYRSTMEIIQFANGIIAHSGVAVSLAVPVFRSGEQVRVEQAAKRLPALVQAVRQLSEEAHGTIAVIGRTEKECAAIHKELVAAGFSPALLTASQQSYGGGLSVLPVYLSKGFEFDAVLVADVDEIRYKDSPRDAKLLYVACTRALHDLRLQYTGRPSPLLPAEEA
ncbi:UvrD-helicase domain-containing protein [Paenibacillus sp. YN15]|uniref:HelD family protein n=1 Tax=Paenibacillus sp. YN15 TaxID=1742774 RepID=UPI000DCDB505|nr:UvrD-helicase domain-containing protein [Paenibacillus sp. YN15]RAV04071.1 DNA helicase UvrD [Paenibacillus sp. YN15]